MAQALSLAPRSPGRRPPGVLQALMLCALAACGAPAVDDAPQEPEDVQAAAISIADLTQTGALGLTPHFRAWLTQRGYGAHDFARADIAGRGGSFGGRGSDSDKVSRDPVIFIHGNSDKAVGTAAAQVGWTPSLQHFLKNGYRPAELYAITWGDADPAASALQYHSRAHLTRLRAFVQAVLAYTGAAKVDVIGHSMGVTLMRKALQGGPASDLLAGGDYDLGPSLGDRVDTFVGISGSNRGLTLCFSSPTLPTCGATNGFYPGYYVGLVGPLGVSRLLDGLNSSGRREAAHVYSIWSTADEVIGGGDLVWGRYTSPIPGQDGEIRFGGYPYGHMNSKNLTAAQQLRLVRDHVLTP